MAPAATEPSAATSTSEAAVSATAANRTPVVATDGVAKAGGAAAVRAMALRNRELPEREDIPFYAAEVDGVIQRQDDFNEQVLAQWILDSRLPVRMQMQLHKLIWGDESGR